MRMKMKMKIRMKRNKGMLPVKGAFLLHIASIFFC